MYTCADVDHSQPAPTAHPFLRELETVLELRRRVIDSREHLYCSHEIRALIETEIPHLVALLASVSPKADARR